MRAVPVFTYTFTFVSKFFFLFSFWLVSFLICICVLFLFFGVSHLWNSSHSNHFTVHHSRLLEIERLSSVHRFEIFGFFFLFFLFVAFCFCFAFVPQCQWQNLVDYQVYIECDQSISSKYFDVSRLIYIISVVVSNLWSDAITKRWFSENENDICESLFLFEVQQKKKKVQTILPFDCYAHFFVLCLMMHLQSWSHFHSRGIITHTKKTQINQSKLWTRMNEWRGWGKKKTVTSDMCVCDFVIHEKLKYTFLEHEVKNNGTRENQERSGLFILTWQDVTHTADSRRNVNKWIQISEKKTQV